MAALTKSTVLKNAWTNIYDRMVANVKTVTLTDTATSTVVTYTGSFPDKELDTKASYPILVVNPPEVLWDEFTLTRKEVTGNITIDIFTTKQESADSFLDAIINSIETYRDTLKDTYLMDWVNLEGTDYANNIRGKMKVHMRSCTFGFKFRFTKT